MEARERISLDDLLLRLLHAEDGLTQELDLESLGVQLREKVDSVKLVLDRLQAEEQWLTGQLDEIVDRRTAVRNNASRLRGYCASVMTQHGYERMPGEKWRCQLQAAKPTVVFDRDPGPLDLQADPELVEMVRSYKWRKDLAEERLNAGLPVPLAHLKQSKYVKFYPKKD